MSTDPCATAAGEVYGKPFHGWSCECDECQGYIERGEPRPGEAPTATAAGEPRYAVTDDGQFTHCLDCGSLVIDRTVHTRFHSILSSQAWTLAVLQNTHLSATTHDRYDAVERIKRRKFDNWSADAFAEVVAERGALDGT